jgi:hypothetical protein
MTARRKKSTQRTAIEIDRDEVGTLDLSHLTEITDTQDADLFDLNKRIKIAIPKGEDYVFVPSGEWIRHNIDGTTSLVDSERVRALYDKSQWHNPPRYKNLAGQRVTPTRINSLLTQNPDGTSRPTSTFFWWKQPDEGYYLAEAKRGLAAFRAETDDNYYVVPEVSSLRPLFRCPKIGPSIHPNHEDLYDDCTGKYHWDIDSEESVMGIYSQRGDISIFVNPQNGQATYICPRCTFLNRKAVGGDGKPVRHAVPRALRLKLEEEGIIPPKKYQYQDRKSEIDKLLKIIKDNQGESPSWLDDQMGWPNGTAQRLITTQLADKVKLARGRNGHKGYKAYIIN